MATQTTFQRNDVTMVPGPAMPSGQWRMLSEPPAAPKLPKGVDAAWDAVVAKMVPLVPRTRRYLARAAQVLALEKQYTQLSQERLAEAAAQMRDLFRLGRQKLPDVIRAFAVVREVAARTMEERPYLEQVAGALALYDGCIVEMATGEGKTLTATLPATVAGWRGRGCHVITVNDYLAKRDAEWMSRIYRFCGLTTAHVEQQMPPPQRRAAYLADITYCTNKEVTADYLRDRLVLGRVAGLPAAMLDKLIGGGGRGPDHMVMRGMEFAIVDEADSVLIDEAVTPLIISGDAPNAEQVEAFQQAAGLARQLEAPRHFRVDHRYREVRLTNAGKQALAELTKDHGGVWAGARRREELVSQALQALQLFDLDKHYVVQEGKVVIVDEFTGRLMPDRTWREGLHQAVEAKETLVVNPPKDTLARVSFQRFFRLYHKLSGMTGTAAENRGEMWQIYHLPTVLVPTHEPCIRRRLPDRVYARADTKWRAIVAEIRAVHEQGRPILVGTRSVHASERLSALLTAAGLEHQVLNAVRHAEEAQIVAGAGQPGKITVATNMAGRGTDIKLGHGVTELGGLHVIATERHESGRVDRQLFGRAGRQGDPGSAVAMVSLEDELVQRYAPKWATKLLARLGSATAEVSSAGTRRLFGFAQRRAERLAWHMRRNVLKSDDWLDEFLGFAGRG